MSSHRYLHDPLPADAAPDTLREIQVGVYGTHTPEQPRIRVPLGSALNEGTLAEDEHEIAPLPLSDEDFIRADQVPPKHT